LRPTSAALRLEEIHSIRREVVASGGAQDRPAGEMGVRPLGASLTDCHGRDHVTHAELAFDGEGKITALRVKTIAISSPTVDVLAR